MSNTTTRTNPEIESYERRALAADRRSELATDDFKKRFEKSNAQTFRWHAAKLRERQAQNEARDDGRHLWSGDINDLGIDLHQEGKSLTVIYGAQVDRDLNYSQACDKLGEAIMHALCCAGRLDADQIKTRPSNLC